MDSPGVLDLIRLVEKEFSIQLSEEELVPDNFQTIERFAAFVQAKSGGNPRPRVGA